MKNLKMDKSQVILRYTDVYNSELPDLIEEIHSLNMHKAISIISELIMKKDHKEEIRVTSKLIMNLTFEMKLKYLYFDIKKDDFNSFINHPIASKNIHLISLQMLLMLLKFIILHGNYDTLDDTGYDISIDDYRKIIELQLIVANLNDTKYQGIKFDAGHFVYSNYHLNYSKNVANMFLRMYYMLEILNRDKTIFSNIIGEYKDYYNDFKNKYDFTITEYLFILFSHLIPYYQNDDVKLSSLTYWKNNNTFYIEEHNRELAKKVISLLSLPAKAYRSWAANTIDNEWNFIKFFQFPFILDNVGNYISISDITLGNAFFEKLFWLIRDCYPKDDDRSMSFFGRLFEIYIQDITEQASNEKYKYMPEFTYHYSDGDIKSSDAYIKNNNKLLVIESKGFPVLADCMIKNERIDDNNKKLFITPVLQADSFLYKIHNQYDGFKEVTEAYIVSVTMESINAVPEYYESIYQAIETDKKSAVTKYYFNFNIEEYESLMNLLENGIDIFALLKKYFNLEYLIPFSSFIKEEGYEMTGTKFMDNIFIEATNKMKEMYFKIETKE